MALIRCQQLEQVLAPSPRTQQSMNATLVSARATSASVQFEIVMNHQCRVAPVAMGASAGLV